MTIMIIQTRYHKMSIDQGNQNKVSVILQNSRGRAYVFLQICCKKSNIQKFPHPFWRSPPNFGFWGSKM